LIQQHTKAFDDNVLAHADIDLAHVEQYQRTIRDARIGPHSFEYHFTLVSCRSTRRPEDEYRTVDFVGHHRRPTVTRAEESVPFMSTNANRR
jgi:hypothetical protein